MKMMTWCSELSYSFTWICMRSTRCDGMHRVVSFVRISCRFLREEKVRNGAKALPPLFLSLTVSILRVSEEGTSLKL